MPSFDSLIATLRHAASERPDHEYLRVAGNTYDFRTALALVESTARGFRELGIEPGDRIGIMGPNVPEVIWAWLGTNAAGIIDVPFNAEARGNLLAYFVEDAGPRVLVGTEEYLATLAATITTDPEFVVCIGDHSTKPFGDRARQLTFEELLELGSASEIELPEPGPGDTATIMYTSGTTGPSKGVMLPQRYYPTQAIIVNEVAKISRDDVSFCVQPLFHIDARAYVAAGAVLMSTHVVGKKFSVSTFWDEIREHGVSIFGTIGTMLWMLHKQPPRPDDGDIPAVRAVCSSTPSNLLREIEDRFGFRIIEAYGMTESLMITSEQAEHTVPGRVGRPMPQLEVQVVDDDDQPVGVGVTGEIIFRPKEHFVITLGYWNKPEATVEAWRNLWFHSGDLARVDEDGYFEYIGRKKDSIRRRGENVSAWEVEQAVSNHENVLEAAAIGVPSEVGEEDVAVLVVLKPGASIDPAELVAFVESDLPRFAVPRYVEVVDSLPKGPSERIEKGKVRERGITAAAWDANVALGRR